ncbi:endonuclease/exonuclease/phosphatase family protein [Archangium violaceum]|uniref:endonuclease/exonuclease/phosphatase family protein n=1 Tax=Archangium violaceum TaxID=83451 RepID=UPI001951E0F3|nr:endonuclease/exonuclease/phosphatase family protein [Archangium violaceum]QRN98618.1 endonuclease/exonuclease/phosphatase family protein [Archangium violaceum]
MPFARLLGTLAVLTVLGACQKPSEEGDPPLDAGMTGDAGTPGGDAGTTGDAGTPPLAFSAANWNLEFFGSPDAGPSNEQLQLDNVRKVISTTGADIWGLEEVVDATHFAALKQQLPGYDGFLANEVPYGSTYYSTTEQKVGLLYRSDVVTLLDKQLILTSSNYDFGTRPPLRVDLRITRDGASVDLVAIVLHMKAFSDMESYDRRRRAALALEDYLDTELMNTPVLVLGDWNDDVDVSITRDPNVVNGYMPTPYKNLLDAPEEYTFLTQPLSLVGQRSTVSNTQFIDHQLVSNELLPRYVSDSAQRLRPDNYISQYGTTTSDHYPVLSRFVFDVTPPPDSSRRLTSPAGSE